MKARLIGFGVIEVEGRRYEHDVVIDRGVVRKRRKGASKALRERYGHTPLTAAEDIPWGGKRLIVGTVVDEETFDDSTAMRLPTRSAASDNALSLFPLPLLLLVGEQTPLLPSARVCFFT